MSDFIDIISRGLAALDIALNTRQLTAMQKYYNILIDWNERINLTAIKDPQAVAVKHFIDSIAPLKFLNLEQSARMVDVGTGAGFPGIPIKIIRPDLELVLVESIHKKAVFLSKLVNELSLPGVQIFACRAEEFARLNDMRAAFDFCICRAVAILPVLLEYCLPLLKVGGRFLALKGPSLEEELPVDKALQILGGRIEQIFKYNLPFSGDARRLLVVEKNVPTPEKYPRRVGLPLKRPLQ